MTKIIKTQDELGAQAGALLVDAFEAGYECAKRRILGTFESAINDKEFKKSKGGFVKLTKILLETIYKMDEIEKAAE